VWMDIDFVRILDGCDWKKWLGVCVIDMGANLVRFFGVNAV
jgi:hypothetical protein